MFIKSHVSLLELRVITLQSQLCLKCLVCEKGLQQLKVSLAV